MPIYVADAAAPAPAAAAAPVGSYVNLSGFQMASFRALTDAEMDSISDDAHVTMAMIIHR